MLQNVLVAALLVVVTTAVHGVGMVFAVQIIEKAKQPQNERRSRTYVYWVGGVILLMFFVALIEVLVWAFAYLAVGALEGLEKATYFSMVTFTTLGYGEIVLDPQWRLLASFEAATGIVMFGWTTALVIAAVQGTFFADRHTS